MLPSPPHRYGFRKATLADGPRINALYNAITGCGRTIEHWHWLWHEPPAGSGVSFVIEHIPPDGAPPEIVGHHGVIRMAGWADGTTIRLGKTENTMVRQDHRERFLYPRMEREMLRLYQAEFDGIFSLRGPLSALRMRTALGYRPGPRVTTEIWCHGRWGRLRSMGRCWWRARRGVPHRLGAWDARIPRGNLWKQQIDSDLRRTLQQANQQTRHGPGVRVAKTPEFIAWRYFHHPARCYAATCLDDLCVIAHDYRHAILVLDEILPGDVADHNHDIVWRPVLQAVLESGYGAISFDVASTNLKYREALQTCGWTMLQVSTASGVSESEGLPIWIDDQGALSERLTPTRWTMGAGASEGP